ncbi:MAG: hypothetical protein R3351_02345 [Nitrospirales bacterium]|nr:hypothetical protein [Nitrospirales bacterium]
MIDLLNVFFGDAIAAAVGRSLPGVGALAFVNPVPNGPDGFLKRGWGLGGLLKSQTGMLYMAEI